MEKPVGPKRFHSAQLLSALDERDGLSPRWQIAAFALVLLAIFSRCPSDFLHAQFYAEDGTVWYQDAYNLSWLTALRLPAGGYLNTIQRLVALLAVLVPLQWAPLTMNLAGLLMQALPAGVLLSPRCRAWGPVPVRMAMVLTYVAIPNASEIHVVLTNSHFHLALLLVLIALADPPCSRLGRAGDILLFALGSVSGPFGLVLLPLLMVFWFVRRQPWTLVLASLLAVGGSVQAWFLLSTVRYEPRQLGASLMLLLRFLGGEIAFNSILGSNGVAPRFPAPVIVASVLCGAMVLFLGCRLGPLSLRLLSIYAGLLLAAALKQPLIGGELPPWEQLLRTPACRYWFFPSLVFLWCAVWCALRGKASIVRYAGRIILCLTLVGIVRNWIYPPFPKSDFALSVDRYQHAADGERVLIPTYPTSDPMVLIKHESWRERRTKGARP